MAGYRCLTDLPVWCLGGVFAFGEILKCARWEKPWNFFVCFRLSSSICPGGIRLVPGFRSGLTLNFLSFNLRYVRLLSFVLSSGSPTHHMSLNYSVVVAIAWFPALQVTAGRKETLGW